MVARWTPTIAIGIAIDLTFVALAAFIPTPLLIRIPVIAFFGGAAVFSAAVVLSRKVALWLDQAGVTFWRRTVPVRRHHQVPPMG